MLYFDTSFVLPLFLEESTSTRVEQFFRRQPLDELVVSQWTRVEFSSALAREVRMGALDRRSALEIDAQFEAVVSKAFRILLPNAADFDLSKQYICRYETRLRAGDALHLAIACNNGAEAIFSLDHTLIAAGRLLDLPVKTGIRTG